MLVIDKNSPLGVESKMYRRLPAHTSTHMAAHENAREERKVQPNVP